MAIGGERLAMSSKGKAIEGGVIHPDVTSLGCGQEIPVAPADTVSERNPLTPA
jgi:hypothetical protein